jgi:hypothetical protein
LEIKLDFLNRFSDALRTMSAIPRAIEPLFDKTLKTFRCCALLGPRQVGKSFLLQDAAARRGGAYHSLDDPLLRAEVARDPLGWLDRVRTRGRLFVIDEAVKCPEIFSAVKVVVDREDPKPTQIALAGSANYLLVRSIRESLAGRVALLWLHPVSWAEVSGDGVLPQMELLPRPKELARLFRSAGRRTRTEVDRQRELLLTRGGFPAVVMNGTEGFARQWASSYFSTYLLPLSLDLFRIAQPAAYERLFRLLVLRSGQLVNYSDLARGAGISVPTVQSYVEYLRAMMVLEELPPFFRNLGKRLVKAPKVHVCDPLLLLEAAGGRYSLDWLRTMGLAGPLYESWIVSEIRRNAHYGGSFHRYSFWRTADGAEVDLIVEAGGRSIPIEIKFAPMISRRDLSGLRSFLEAGGGDIGYVVYTGHEMNEVDKGIWALPDSALLLPPAGGQRARVRGRRTTLKPRGARGGPSP